jgi:hypothetical protein
MHYFTPEAKMSTPSLDARDAERGLLSRRLDAVVLLELFDGLAARYSVEAAPDASRARVVLTSPWRLSPPPRPSR